MKISNILKSVPLKNKIMVSVFALSLSLGSMMVLDKNNSEVIKGEQSLISEMTNKTLNISFVPNNPNMKNNINLFTPINDSDISNIGKIQGVKSVKPISSDFNPLSGYAKIDNQSSYIELYGMDEKGDDINKNNIEMLYGRTINANDVGKNVVVLNMESVDSMQITNPKDLLGKGLEINGAIYEVIGIMNVVEVDERDNTNELQYASLIPKSTSKEVVARANSDVGVYGSISIQIEEGYNINAVESSVYNVLYENHSDINGYYERDSEYSLPKKLGPTLVILDNFLKLSSVLTCGVMGLSIISLIKVLIVYKKKNDYDDTKEFNKNENESNEESVKEVDSDEEVVENTESLEKSYSLFKDMLIKVISLSTVGLAISYLLSTYYLLDINIDSLFNISILLKVIILFIAIFLMTSRDEKTEK